MTGARRALLFALVLLPCPLQAAVLSASPIEIKTALWGFDGKVCLHRVNLLSMVIANRTGDPYDGVLKLYGSAGLGGKVGDVLVRRCVISPHAAVVVQFHPYVPLRRDTWTLESGSGLGEDLELDQPGPGGPARVLLADPENPPQAAGLRTFPSDFFPTTVAATDGLHSLVIDHVPRRWAPVQRQAFLDWLRRGGRVHLLPGPNGKRLTFPDDLYDLNRPDERFGVGAGMVFRHRVGRADVDLDFLDKPEYGIPEVQESDRPSSREVDWVFFRALGEMTQPRFNWGLIYLAIVAYIALVVAVNYFYGRRRRNYRLTLLFFIATVGAFSLILGYLGRRGHDETTVVHSVAYARHVGGDGYDVTQWGNAFVTRGATYTITHDAAHNIYSTCQRGEAARGQILNGKAGRFVVDIPLYSARTFLHRAKLKGHDLGLSIAHWTPGTDHLEALALKTGPGFPEQVRETWVRHGDFFYPLRVGSGHLELLAHGREDTERFLDPGKLSLGERRPGWGDDRRRRAHDDPEEALRRFVRPLIARSLGRDEAIGPSGGFRAKVAVMAARDDGAPPRPRAGDRVEVFVFARSPESFQILDPAEGRRFGKRLGYVLYHIDLFLPGETP